MKVEPRFLKQRSHFVAPANVKEYLEKTPKLGADVVVFDMDDALPQDDPEQIKIARKNIIEVFSKFDFAGTLKFFRPRGFERDRGFDDIRAIVIGAGKYLDGLIYPKVENIEVLKELCKIVSYLELTSGIPEKSLKLGLMIESVKAIDKINELASFSDRTVCLIFGAFDYWKSISSPYTEFNSKHPLLDSARVKVVEAAASAGVLSIAEMSRIYPSSKMDAETLKKAEEAFASEASRSKALGFWGKWVGNPAQLKIVHEIFTIPDRIVEQAKREVEAFEKSSKEGRATLLVNGRLVDVATYEMSKKVVELAKKLKPQA